jgi:hypothetical protein
VGVVDHALMVVVVVHSALLADESEYYSLSQVLMRRHCMERVAAAVGLCTRSYLVLEEVGKTVYTIIIILPLLFCLL